MEFRKNKDIDVEQLYQLYQSVGWMRYTKELIIQAYEHASCVLSAWDGDTLVGVIRCVGDGITILYVQDVLVLPTYQRKKIATRLFQELLQQEPNVHKLMLLCDDSPSLHAFYEAMGLDRVEKMHCVAYARFR